MDPSKTDEPGSKLYQLLVRICPVDPGQLIILAVGVVIALLRVSGLVAAQKHGYALGKEQGSKEVQFLATTEIVDSRIIRRSFHTAVPGKIVEVAILVV